MITLSLSLSLSLFLRNVQNGLTALHKAAKRGHSAVVKQLVASKRFDVNTQDKYGWTPLHWSAWSGQVSVIQALLSSNKCNVNAVDRVSKKIKKTRLYLASSNNRNI